jgi:hypothetical protein
VSSGRWLLLGLVAYCALLWTIWPLSLPRFAMVILLVSVLLVVASQAEAS